jgi:hypothetical protein
MIDGKQYEKKYFDRFRLNSRLKLLLGLVMATPIKDGI